MNEQLTLAKLQRIVSGLENDLVGNQHLERIKHLEGQMRQIVIILQSMRGSFKNINDSLRGKL